MSATSYRKFYLTEAQCQHLKRLLDHNEARLIEEMEKAGKSLSPQLIELVQAGVQECRVLSELFKTRP